jgi:hypothetical protein
MCRGKYPFPLNSRKIFGDAQAYRLETAVDLEVAIEGSK